MENAPQPPAHLRVVSLRTTNFKRVKAVQIDPPAGDPLVLIGGEIDQGKSSVLDSMLDALGGADASPEIPVRRGMKKSETVIDIGEITIRVRHTSAGGRELVLEDKDGNRLKKPQDVLDKLTGKIGFDAEDFIRRRPDDQLSILRKIVGIDFAPLEAKKAKLYDERRDANATVRSLETQIVPPPIDPPAELVDVTATLEEMKNAQKHNESIDDAFDAVVLQERFVRDQETTLAGVRNEMYGIQEQIDRLTAQLKSRSERENNLIPTIGAEQTKAQKMRKDAEALARTDIAPLQAKIAGADAANTKHRQMAAYKAAKEALAKAHARATALDNAVQEIEAEKQRLMESAKFPVKGLGFTEAGITFDGLPFEQAASSTKRRVSVAIGAALNPKLRVTVIKDGSLLGAKGLEQIRELAREFDLQVWIEVVTSDEEDRARCTVVIEDGTVVGAPKFEEANEPEAQKGAAQSAVVDADPPADLFSGLPAQ